MIVWAKIRPALLCTVFADLEKTNKTIWLLSAYCADSHAYWADWLVQTFNDIHWHKLELPGRHFRWRIRGNPLSWLHRLPDEQPDLILATSMVDLSTLKGLHPRLAEVPCLYYFHENQFAYPVSTNQFDSIEPEMVQLYGSLAADRLLFNSGYNRDSFLQGVEKLLQRLPDEVPDDVVALLSKKSEVLPLLVKPIVPQSDESVAVEKNKRLILWNHRWEYDKAPSIFVKALHRLDKLCPDFELALLGNRANIKPAELCEIESAFGDRIVVNDRVPHAEYERWLLRATVVISTAIHEFQGLSVMQAISAGAVPLVPDALCYREQYGPMYRYPAGDSKKLAEKLSQYLARLPPQPDISAWCSEALAERWHQLLKES
jgi:glycosyltransferase involved in cell wall biosynthesis